jgi:hypothetical protein
LPDDILYLATELREQTRKTRSVLMGLGAKVRGSEEGSDLAAFAADVQSLDAHYVELQKMVDIIIKKIVNPDEEYSVE